MMSKVQVTLNACECDLCHYRWVSNLDEPPLACPNKGCRSREWNGQKLPSYANQIKLPAPRRVGRPKTVALIDIREDR